MQITNIKELRTDLLQNYTSLKSGKLSVAKAKELANTAGKVITSVKVELDYNSMMGNKKQIPFLES